MSDATKPVATITTTDPAVPLCCPHGTRITITPCVRPGRGGIAQPVQYGYFFETEACPCPPRWLAHDWRQRPTGQGPAEFIHAGDGRPARRV